MMLLPGTKNVTLRRTPSIREARPIVVKVTQEEFL